MHEQIPKEKNCSVIENVFYILNKLVKQDAANMNFNGKAKFPPNIRRDGKRFHHSKIFASSAVVMLNYLRFSSENSALT